MHLLHSSALPVNRGVSASGSNLVLSYSNTGMISLEDLGIIAAEEFKGRSIEVLSTDYKHMTLGRQFDRDRTYATRAEAEVSLWLVQSFGERMCPAPAGRAADIR